ncbi:MAG: hypothetical protein K6F86_05020 [Lachnospiraceae bacterium]|nr:hypothetical protein [Lachnospiraceae bacterium]
MSKKRKRRRQKVLIARFIFAMFVVLIMGLLVVGGFSMVKKFSESKDRDIEVSTLIFEKNGGIKQVIVEDFDPSLYDEAGLRAMIEEELSRFGKAIDMDSLEVEDGKAKLTLLYDDVQVCANFNGISLYADTIDDLKKKGVNFPGDALLAEGKNAVILSASTDVIVPKKIRYSSPGVTVDQDDERHASVIVESGKNALIIY